MIRKTTPSFPGKESDAAKGDGGDREGGAVDSPNPVASNTICLLCGAVMIVSVHCKLVCKNCGAVRDCSDP